MKDQLTYTELELISGLQQNNRSAQEYLITKYAGALEGLVRQILPEMDEVMEVVTVSFVKIIRNINEFDPQKSRLFTWMLQTTRELALQKLKDPAFRRLPVKAAPNEGHIIGKLAKKLGQDRQDLVELSYFRGYSTGELATRLNIEEDSVKKELKLALSHLNKLL